MLLLLKFPLLFYHHRERNTLEKHAIYETMVFISKLSAFSVLITFLVLVMYFTNAHCTCIVWCPYIKVHRNRLLISGWTIREWLPHCPLQLRSALVQPSMSTSVTDDFQDLTVQSVEHFLPDQPRGVLDDSRRRASFSWKKMALFLEDSDCLQFKLMVRASACFIGISLCFFYFSVIRNELCFRSSFL